jgi:hypothetical protein
MLPPVSGPGLPAIHYQQTSLEIDLYIGFAMQNELIQAPFLVQLHVRGTARIGANP